MSARIGQRSEYSSISESNGIVFLGHTTASRTLIEILKEQHRANSSTHLRYVKSTEELFHLFDGKNSISCIAVSADLVRELLVYGRPADDNLHL